MRRLFLWGCALILTGCPQTVRPLVQDAALIGDAEPGRDAQPGLDGAVEDAGAADLGVSDAGANSTYQWTSLTLPPDTRAIVALWGRGPNEIYVGTSNGHILLFDGSQWSNVWRVPNNFGVRAIDGTAQHIFVAGERNLYVHPASPSANPETFAAGNDIGGLSVVDDNLAFLVSERTSSRGLFRYDGAAVTEVASNLQVASINGVWAQTGGQAWVAGNGRFVVYDGTGITEAPVQWPMGWSASDIANFFLYDITALSGHRLAVGTGGGVMSDESGTWRFERARAGSDDFEAVTALPLGAGPSVMAVAVGEPVSGSPIHLRTPEGWSPSSYQGNTHLLSVWAVGADEVYAGGARRSSLDGVLLRGRR